MNEEEYDLPKWKKVMRELRATLREMRELAKQEEKKERKSKS